MLMEIVSIVTGTLKRIILRRHASRVSKHTTMWMH